MIVCSSQITGVKDPGFPELHYIVRRYLIQRRIVIARIGPALCRPVPVSRRESTHIGRGKLPPISLGLSTKATTATLPHAASELAKAR
jgi:hypothetical protein